MSLLAAWRGELEARYVYDVVASRERDPRRADILCRIAAGETAHRTRIEARLQEMGVPLPDPATVRPSPWLWLQARLAPIDRLLRAREAAEDDEILARYGTPTGNPWTAGLASLVSTGLGAIIPVLPFFWVGGGTYLLGLVFQVST